MSKQEYIFIIKSPARVPFDRSRRGSHPLDKITQIGLIVASKNFSRFSFPHLASLPPPSARMTLSSHLFSSDPDSSLSSDNSCFPSQSSLPRNQQFLPALDMGTINGYNVVLDDDVSYSQRAPAHLGTNVRAAIRL